MSSIKLKHSGGNVVSLNSPTSAPTSADVAFKLPNADGTNGQVLKTDGSGNLSFGADTGGKILQVVTNTNTSTSNVTTTSTSFITLTSTYTTFITPSATTSKIFVIMSAPAFAGNPYNGGIADFTIGRNGSPINNYSYGSIYTNAAGNTYMPLTMHVLDSPNTTSQTAYNFMCKSNSASNAVGVGAYGANEVISVTLFEVGA